MPPGRLQAPSSETQRNPQNCSSRDAPEVVRRPHARRSADEVSVRTDRFRAAPAAETFPGPNALSEMDKKTTVLLLVARIGLGVIFLASGLGKIAGWGGTVAYAGGKGVPEFLLACATALEIFGGVR